MGIELSKYTSLEKEQAPEEKRLILERALKEGLHVDLVINNLAGEPTPAPDLIVEEFEGNNLMMTYLAEDGDVGELIPLSFSRIKKVDLKNE